MTLRSPTHRFATYVGLIVALFAAPTVMIGFRLIVGEGYFGPQLFCRELVMVAVVALLLWIVKTRERLPLTSIGLLADGLGKSILWGIAFTVVSLVVTVGLYLLLQQLGV
jgi:hypothetical protein